MTSLIKSQQESIIKRLSFIDVELQDLCEMETMDYETYQKDRIKRRNIERMAENIANTIIDIGKIILISRNIEVPGKYIEVFSRLYECSIIDEELAGRLAELSRTRNTLAHHYLDIKWKRLELFIDEGPRGVRDFMDIIQQVIESE